MKFDFTNISNIYSVENRFFEDKLDSMIFDIFGSSLKLVRLHKRGLFFEIILHKGVDFVSNKNLDDIRKFGFTEVIKENVRGADRIKAYFEENTDDEYESIFRYTNKELKHMGIEF